MPAASLEGLQELPLPAPPSWAPQTAGWLVLALVVAATLAWLWWRRRQRWLADAYRRAARAELAVIERGLESDRHVAASLPALVKRTALAFTPRTAIARLSDAEWLAFLDRTYPPGGFVDGPGRLLPALAYAPDDAVPPERLGELVGLVGRWIDGHHAPV